MGLYITDRQRVELSLPSHMILAVMMGGINEETQQTDEFKAVKADLVEAGTEALNDLPAKKINSLLNRAKTLNISMFKAMELEKASLPFTGLVFFHMIRTLIECGFLQYGEGTAIDRSIKTFMDSLEEHANEGDQNVRALHRASQFLYWLQAQGYYQGIHSEP